MNTEMINVFGLPYHGQVVDHRLTLTNGHTIDYPGFISGDTQLVAIPNYPPVNRTPEQQDFDCLHGLQWRNYAIVADNHLGTANLGLNWLLYIDENQTVWYLKLGYHVSNNQCVISCTLHSVFGRFDSRFKPVSRLLAEKRAQFYHPGKLLPLNRFTFERKPDGAEVLIHVYGKFEGENTIEFPQEMSLYEIWKIELKGNGLLSFDENLGKGITATITKHLSFEAVQTFYTRNVPRSEKRFRLGKVNIQGRYEPKPVEPPDCASNTYHESFRLALIPEGEDFIPFRHDQNTYLQTDWYGPEEIKNAIVRMLYDSEGIAHTFGIQRVTKRQSKLHQCFSGQGSATQGPFDYFFNGFSCVVNGYGPGLSEQYNGLQTVKAHFRIVHEANMLLDGQVINTLSLEGEVTQIAETVVNQSAINSVNVKVRINDQSVREVSHKQGEIMNDIISNPFVGYFNNDDINGVYAKFHFGFASNNLIGQISSRYKSAKDPQVIKRVAQSVSSVKNQHLENRKLEQLQLYGTLEPLSNEIIINHTGIQSWA